MFYVHKLCLPSTAWRLVGGVAKDGTKNATTMDLVLCNDPFDEMVQIDSVTRVPSDENIDSGTTVTFHVALLKKVRHMTASFHFGDGNSSANMSFVISSLTSPPQYIAQVAHIYRRRGEMKYSLEIRGSVKKEDVLIDEGVLNVVGPSFEVYYCVDTGTDDGNVSFLILTNGQDNRVSLTFNFGDGNLSESVEVHAAVETPEWALGCSQRTGFLPAALLSHAYKRLGPVSTSVQAQLPDLTAADYTMDLIIGS